MKMINIELMIHSAQPKVLLERGRINNWLVHSLSGRRTNENEEEQLLQYQRELESLTYRPVGHCSTGL